MYQGCLVKHWPVYKSDYNVVLVVYIEVRFIPDALDFLEGIGYTVAMTIVLSETIFSIIAIVGIVVVTLALSLLNHYIKKN